jgi:hypothetical protein
VLERDISIHWRVARLFIVLRSLPEASHAAMILGVWKRVVWPIKWHETLILVDIMM